MKSGTRKFPLKRYQIIEISRNRNNSMLFRHASNFVMINSKKTEKKKQTIKENNFTFINRPCRTAFYSIRNIISK